MVRAMTPVFTVMISIVFLQKQYPRKIYISLLPVTLRDFSVVQNH